MGSRLFVEFNFFKSMHQQVTSLDINTLSHVCMNSFENARDYLFRNKEIERAKDYLRVCLLNIVFLKDFKPQFVLCESSTVFPIIKANI
jgi:hypothetical protein